MAERNGDGERFANIYLFPPTEQIINADGTVINRGMGFMVASDKEAAEEGYKIARDHGLEVQRDGDSGRKGTFVFSNWNAPWNPEGPKKNWRVDPPAEGANLN